MDKKTREFVIICKDTLPYLEPVCEFNSSQVLSQESFANLLSESVKTVLILDMLECVEFPRKVLSESYRILKPKGICIITSHMNQLIYNPLNDYWRFAPEGFMSLLEPFDFRFTGFAGKEKFPHTVVGIGFKKQPRPLDRFWPFYEDWKADGENWKEWIQYKQETLKTSFRNQGNS